MNDAMNEAVSAAQAEESGAGVRYLGNGENYVEGVPARDLTRAEWNLVRADLKALALATGLYRDPLAANELVRPEGEANARKGKSNPK